MKYVAILNEIEEPVSVSYSLKKIGVTNKVTVRDLWNKTDLGSFKDTFITTIPFHSGKLYSIKYFFQERNDKLKMYRFYA